MIDDPNGLGLAPELSRIWVYLSSTPLLWLTLTLGAYVIGDAVYRASRLNPLANPVLIAVAVLAGLLVVTDTPYRDYFDGAQFVHFLLGPATVALAVPLYRQTRVLRRSWLAVAAAIGAGSVTAAVSAGGIAQLAGAAPETVLSLVPKSVTTPIAMGISDQIGGLASLTAVFVILTGMIGAAFGPLVLSLCGIRDWRVRGLAIGVAAHGIGTARAFAVNDRAGAFAGLAMGLNALISPIVIPVLARLW